MKKVGFVGVGKLGQDCAEVMAQFFSVVGYDVLPRNPANFEMMETLREAVEGKDFVFVAVQTPHDLAYGGETPTSHLPKKDFDYATVESCLKNIDSFLTKETLVVLISTTLPGTVKKRLAPQITKGRFIYNPYLIAMGTTKWDMVNPEMVIIGTEDGSETGDAQELIEFYRVFMENNPRYVMGTWTEAECIKIFYNTAISMKLSLVNMIQDVAQKNGDVNTDIVTTALANSTQRIVSRAYMKAGLGDSGGCHPRDLIALSSLSEKLNLGYDLFGSIVKVREEQARNIAIFIAEICKKQESPVVILGKSYKPGVEYINGSYSMLIAYYLEKMGICYRYENDPKIDGEKVYFLAHRAHFYDYPFNKNSVVIDPWREFRSDKVEIIQYGNTRS